MNPKCGYWMKILNVVNVVNVVHHSQILSMFVE